MKNLPEGISTLEALDLIIKRLHEQKDEIQEIKEKVVEAPIKREPKQRTEEQRVAAITDRKKLSKIIRS